MVYPVVVGTSSDKLLSHLTGEDEGISLELLETSAGGNGTVMLHY